MTSFTLPDLFGQGYGQHVAVYVPGTRNTSQPLTPEEHRRIVLKTVKRLSLLYGGATAVDTEGGWYSAAEGRVITERVTVVFSFAAALTQHDLATLRRFCKVLKKTLAQEALAVQINGELFFV